MLYNIVQIVAELYIENMPLHGLFKVESDFWLVWSDFAPKIFVIPQHIVRHFSDFLCFSPWNNKICLLSDCTDNSLPNYSYLRISKGGLFHLQRRHLKNQLNERTHFEMIITISESHYLLRFQNICQLFVIIETAFLINFSSMKLHEEFLTESCMQINKFWKLFQMSRSQASHSSESVGVTV